MSDLRAPFPWFGGKRRAAALIWERLGDVANYVDPFMGSAAVLLARPSEPRIETVNDADALLANFWRAVRVSPDEVARHADWPVNEADLHARHLWLVRRKPEIREAAMADPDWCDPKAAGWWVWGLSQWIGSGWCDEKVQRADKVENKRPVVSADSRGRGVVSLSAQAPRCNGLGGQGIHGAKVPQKIPRIDAVPGRGTHSAYATEGGINAWFADLSARLRRVRVCCGDWKRVTGDSVILGNGVTGILLDPPYDGHADLYAEGNEVFREAAAWAVSRASDPRLRIILCGYEGHFEPPPGWETVEWTANGGYGNVAGNLNKHRERLWCSPACLRPAPAKQLGLALGAAHA